MKLETILLLGSLVLSQNVVSPLYAMVQGEEMSLLSVRKKKHNVHLKTTCESRRKRNMLPIATGYIEDNALYLSFDFLLNNNFMRVVDAETGGVVFEGIVSGTSLSIPLERDSESFDVYIQ